MSLSSFASQAYQEHNQARLKHLAQIVKDVPIELRGKRVLEVGSGPGDHTGFFLERGCTVVSVDSRAECCKAVRARHGNEAHVVDMNNPDLARFGTFDVVYCYGLLYHLENPRQAIVEMDKVCTSTLLLETCVAHAPTLDALNITAEANDATQSSTGRGCRPDRRWLFSELCEHFAHVYQTRSQPRHREFPTDWTLPPTGLLSRVVYIASRMSLDERHLSPEVLDRHT